MGKKLAIYGYYGQNNVGDDYIMTSVINSALKANVSDIAVFVKDTAFENYNFPSNVHFLLLPRSKILRQMFIAYHAAKSDKFIIGGGGLWPDDSLSKVLCNYFHILIASAFKTKVILYGIEITTVRNDRSKKFWKRLLKHVDWATTRTQESLKILQQLSPSTVSFYSPDVTFAISDDELVKYGGNTITNQKLPDGKFVLWALAMPWTSLEMEQEHYQLRYKRFLQAILDVQEKTNQLFPDAYNVIVPFLKYSDDCLINDLLEHGFTNATVYRPDLYDVRPLFSKALFAIDMRFHSVIFSLFESCSFAAISYSPKTTDTLLDNNNRCFTEFGIRDSAYFYKEFDLDVDDFTKKIEKIYHSEQEMLRLDELKASAMKSALKLVDWINDDT